MPARYHYLYKTWTGMRSRCSNPNHHQFKNYGARGITVCDRWNDFWAFVKDMGPRPDGYTLDRINNNDNYEPSNCRWASQRTQNNNRRMRTVVVNDDPMNCIVLTPYGYRVHTTLMPKQRHTKHFLSLEDAQEYRDLCDYERVFHRILLSQ
jgi:hypothetical protein